MAKRRKSTPRRFCFQCGSVIDPKKSQKIGKQFLCKPCRIKKDKEES